MRIGAVLIPACAAAAAGVAVYLAWQYQLRGTLARGVARSLELSGSDILYAPPHAKNNPEARTLGDCGIGGTNAADSVDCAEGLEQCRLHAVSCRHIEVSDLAGNSVPSGDREHPWCSSNWFGERTCVVALPSGRDRVLVAISVW